MNLECIKSTCKKLDEMAIKFVDSVDCSIQAKIEKNIEDGKLMKFRFDELKKKQNELRDEIDNREPDYILSDLKDLVKGDVISNKIQDVFTYYYTHILDRIQSEARIGMTDATVAIRDLDISINLIL